MPIGREIKKYDNSLWLQIFYHYNPEGKYGFLNEEEALNCTNDENKFSILYTIDSRYKIKGLYEFIIEYPELGTYNRWKQKNNPINETEDWQTPHSAGFQPIETKAQLDSWGGLVRTRNDIKEYSSAPSLLNGTPGSVTWYFAIGQYKDMRWNLDSQKISVIPSNRIPVQIVSLWLKLPNKYAHSLSKCMEFPGLLTFIAIFIL